MYVLISINIFNTNKYQNIMEMLRKFIVYIINYKPSSNFGPCSVHLYMLLDTNFGEENTALYKNLGYILN